MADREAAWYFLPRAQVPENATALLKSAGITMVDNGAMIMKPIKTGGLVFLTANPEAALTALGIHQVSVKYEDTDREGITLLRTAPKRRQAAGDEIIGAFAPPAPREAREGADAFVESYCNAIESSRRDLKQDVEDKSGEIDALSTKLMALERSMLDLELEALVLERVGEEARQALAREYEEIRREPRVDRLQVTDTHLIVTTTDITIEEGPSTYRIGPLRFTLGLIDGSILIQALQKFGPTPHPQVSRTGVAELGPLRDIVVRAIGSRKFAQALALLLDLFTGPPRDDAPLPLTLWQMVSAGNTARAEERAAAPAPAAAVARRAF